MLVAACGSGSGGSVDDASHKNQKKTSAAAATTTLPSTTAPAPATAMLGQTKLGAVLVDPAGMTLSSWTATPWRRRRAPPRARASGRRSPSPGARCRVGAGYRQVRHHDRCERRPGHVRRASALPVRERQGARRRQRPGVRGRRLVGRRGRRQQDHDRHPDGTPGDHGAPAPMPAPMPAPTMGSGSGSGMGNGY